VSGGTATARPPLVGREAGDGVADARVGASVGGQDRRALDVAATHGDQQRRATGLGHVVPAGSRGLVSGSRDRIWSRGRSWRLDVVGHVVDVESEAAEGADDQFDADVVSGRRAVRQRRLAWHNQSSAIVVVVQARRQDMKWGLLFVKMWKMGVFLVKQWTFPQRRVHYVQ